MPSPDDDAIREGHPLSGPPGPFAENETPKGAIREGLPPTASSVSVRRGWSEMIFGGLFGGLLGCVLVRVLAGPLQLGFIRPASAPNVSMYFVWAAGAALVGAITGRILGRLLGAAAVTGDEESNPSRP